MAELSTLARPYAKAAFEFAAGRGELALWSAGLGAAAAVSREKKMAALLGSPSHTAGQMAEAMTEVCGEVLSAGVRNFIGVLADNGRLPLLPQIHSLFERYRAEREKRVEVEVISAFPLTPEAEQSLARALSRRLEREISLVGAVDKELLGGVLIRAGDLVIDGSLRGRLRKLAEAINT